jgi:hypothetical protein
VISSSNRQRNPKTLTALPLEGGPGWAVEKSRSEERQFPSACVAPSFPPFRRGGQGGWGASDVVAEPLIRLKRRAQANANPADAPGSIEAGDPYVVGSGTMDRMAPCSESRWQGIQPLRPRRRRPVEGHHPDLAIISGTCSTGSTPAPCGASWPARTRTPSPASRRPSTAGLKTRVRTVTPLGRTQPAQRSQARRSG